MNKPLFWTGIGLQGIHLIAFMIFGLTLISWNWFVVLAIGYLIFNFATLTMIFMGAFIKDKK